MKSKSAKYRLAVFMAFFAWTRVGGCRNPLAASELRQFVSLARPPKRTPGKGQDRQRTPARLAGGLRRLGRDTGQNCVLDWLSGFVSVDPQTHRF